MKRFINSKQIIPVIIGLLLTVFFSFEASCESDSVITYSMIGAGCSVQSCDINAEGEIIIPDTYDGIVVTSISDGAFKDCIKISSIVLPETIKTIGSEAFLGCSNLTSVTIPDSVVSLGDSLFYKCVNLTDVSLSQSLTDIPKKAFYYCVKLQNIDLPSAILSIQKEAFYECRLLEGIVLPESIITVSDSAFENCFALKKVYIPEGAYEIGISAFKRCDNLSAVYYAGNAENAGKIKIDSNNQLLLDSVWYFEHLHSATNLKNNVEATCTQDGYSEYMCECGFCGKSNYVPSSGHNLSVFNVIKQPDCKSEGLIKVSCSRCEHSETMTTPATSHKIVIDEEIAPTCFEEGRTKGSHCSACGEIIEEQTVLPALGHSYSEKIYDKAHLVSEPTYTKEAVYRYSCIRCSAVGDKLYKGDKLILGKPSQIASASTSDSITVAWSKVKNASGYGVYYYRTADKKWVLYKKITASSIRFSSLPAGRTYSFAVKAFVIENGKIIASPYHRIITEATRPSKPSKMAAAQNENAIKIAWSAVSGATGYRVYGFNSKTNSWVVLKTATKTCSHITYNLKSGTFYKFAVKPYIDLGTKIVWCESYSEIITATKPVPPVLKSTALAGAVKLQWSKVSGADGYVIYGSTKPDSGYVRLKVTTSLEHTVSGLNRGQTYYFRAFSVKKTANGYVLSYASDIKAAKTR